MLQKQVHEGNCLDNVTFLLKLLKCEKKIIYKYIYIYIYIYIFFFFNYYYYFFLSESDVTYSQVW